MAVSREGTPEFTRLGSRLRAARRQAFVGRQGELELFRRALADDRPFAVLFVHGPAGVGKTALLEQFEQVARDAGREAIVLDGRSVDASPAGVEQALAEVLDVPADSGLAELYDRPHPVLLFDTYERLAALDGWVRSTLLPQLPAEAVVVIASRHEPAAGWRTDPAWTDLLRVVGLRDLPPASARALLEQRGVDPTSHGELVGVARGHPLALVLAADVWEREGEVPTSLHEAPELIEGLLQRFLREVPSPAHRRALLITAHAEVATEAMLRELLDTDDAAALFDWLCRLSFSQPVSGGIGLHELAAEAIDAELRWRDPDGYAALHRDVSRHLERRAATSSGADQHRAMLDMLRLYRRNPVTRPFFEWSGERQLWPEPAIPADHEPIVELTRQYESDASAEIAEYWLDRQPEAFTVFRSEASTTAGFVAHLMLEAPPSEEVEVDPVAARVWDHVQTHGPLRSSERLSILRFWIAKGSYQGVETHHMVSARCSRDWMTTPQLAWSFVVLADPDFYERLFSFIEFDRFEDLEVTVGGDVFGMFVRDWRRSSQREWAALLRERRLDRTEHPEHISVSNERLLVLSHEDFTEAVKDALRSLTDQDGLSDNPLLRSRVVVEHAGDRPRQEALVELIEGAAAELSGDPKADERRRAVELIYFEPSLTQQAAAERLNLSFSTFRRRLAAAIEHITERLWQLELHENGSQRS